MHPKNNGVCFVGTSGGIAYARDSCVVNNKIYVVNSYRISIFDAENFAYITSFGSQGSGDGQFYDVVSLCSDRQYIYVIDNNPRLQKFTLEGQFISKVGSLGSGDDQFNTTRSIRHHNGKLYLIDYQNNRVKIHLASDLSYVDSFAVTAPLGAFVDAQNNYLVVRTESKLYIYRLDDKSLVKQKAISWGFGCELVNDYLYIPDYYNHKIIKYDYPTLNQIVGSYEPGQGSEPGQLNRPYHLYYWIEKNLILCGNQNSPYYIVGITPELEWKVFDLD